MVRVAPDGNLALADLIRDWTHSSRHNAWKHIQTLSTRGLLPQRDNTYIGNSSSYVVTAEEWDNIKLHMPHREHVWERPRQACLYVVQYDTVWDCVKIGRASDVAKRLCSLKETHNFRLVFVASFPGYCHTGRLVHKQLPAYRSAEGTGSEWFNAPAQYAITVISELIEQNRPVSLSSSESEL